MLLLLPLLLLLLLLLLLTVTMTTSATMATTLQTKGSHLVAISTIDSLVFDSDHFKQFQLQFLSLVMMMTMMMLMIERTLELASQWQAKANQAAGLLQTSRRLLLNLAERMWFESLPCAAIKPRP